MQQWFEEDKSPTNSSVIISTNNVGKTKETEISLLKTFIIEAKTTPGQHICVSGSCPTLGNWEVNDAFVLTNTNLIRIENNQTYYIWSGKVHLPAEKKKIYYRYFVAYILEPESENVKHKHVFVHSWESHPKPRIIHTMDEIELESNNCLPFMVSNDIYGQNGQKISKGFLTEDCAIQFKLYDPITFWKPKFQKRIDMVSIKITPVPLSKLSNDSNEKSLTNNCLLDDSNSLTSDDGHKLFAWPLVECVEMPGNPKLRQQNQFGTLLKKNSLHLFEIRNHNFGYTGYLIDIYIYKENFDEPPYHIGFTHILPSNMKYSNGVIMCPITSVRQKPIGELKIEYLIIKPLKDIHCNLEKICLTDWKSFVPLEIGHRGSGSSFKQPIAECTETRENTIASFKEAASKGADFVEFDVQLTKDLVPIIFHDFHVSMATKSKTDVLEENIEMVQIPLKDLSFEQLQTLKIYHVKEPYGLSEFHTLNDLRSDYQPFPKLKQAFTDIDINVGFNIELKWTMKRQDGTFECDNPFDMNLFVDTILKTTFEFAESRNIVFSCFHPDVCILLKMKQNRYPVLYLTQGVTDRYPPYDDPRCQTIQTAIFHSLCHDLLGVNVHSEDLLRDSSQINMVKEAGLVLFCWGEDNNSKDVLEKLKKLGVDAVIFDRSDLNDFVKNMFGSSNTSGVFIADSYCDQNAILLSKNQSLVEDAHQRENNDRVGDNNKYFMDVGKATFQNPSCSTETLWDETNSIIKNSKLPSRKQRFDCTDTTLKTDITSTVSKKSKSDVE